MPSYSIKGGDKAMIRNIVGRFHVGMSEAEVADAVVKKLAVYAPSNVISAVKRYAAQVHRANRKLYGRVMGGMNPKRPKCKPGECLLVIKGKRAVCRICGSVYRALGKNPRSRRNHEMKEYRLGSANFVFAPGFVKWAMNGYRGSRGKERENFVKMIYTGWSIPREAALGLLRGEFPHRVEGEAVVFSVPTGTLFNRRRR